MIYESNLENVARKNVPNNKKLYDTLYIAAWYIFYWLNCFCIVHIEKKQVLLYFPWSFTNLNSRFPRGEKLKYHGIFLKTVMGTWEYQGIFFRWGTHPNMSLFPSVRRAPYLRNCTSCDHNFWYTCVKYDISRYFFSFLKKFNFLGR